MTLFRPSAILAMSALALAVACADYTSRQSAIVTSPDSVAAAPASGNAVSGPMAATPLSATMQFGLEDVGTGYPPPTGHDSSWHANDTIVPQTVVIDKGGTVTFNLVGIHELAIYGNGKQPQDVSLANLIPHPCDPTNLPPLIDDGVDRIGVYSAGCGPRTYTQTFPDPGKYLVICSVVPHFQAKMYGWVTVRNK